MRNRFIFVITTFLLFISPIYSQTFMDVGQTWSRLLTFNDTGLVNMQEPNIVDDKLSLTFAWGSKNLQEYGGKFYLVYEGNPDDSEKDIYLKTSEDALTWSERIEISDGLPGTIQRFPKMVIRGDPNSPDIYVAWQDDRSGTGVQIRIATSNDGGMAWSNSTLVKDTPEAVFVPIDLALDENGIIYMSWNEVNASSQGYITWFSKSLDGGLSWSEAFELHTGSEFSYHSQIVAKANGDVMVGIMEAEWVQGWTTNLVVYTTNDSGDTWGVGTRPTT